MIFLWYCLHYREFNYVFLAIHSSWKDLYLDSLKQKTCSSVFGSIIHDGLILLSSLYLMKNLASVFIFVICGASDIIILLISTSSIVIRFLGKWNFCFSISSPLNFKNYLTISLILFWEKNIFLIGEKKVMEYFCWGVNIIPPKCNISFNVWDRCIFHY